VRLERELVPGLGWEQVLVLGLELGWERVLARELGQVPAPEQRSRRSLDPQARPPPQLR